MSVADLAQGYGQQISVLLRDENVFAVARAEAQVIVKLISPVQSCKRSELHEAESKANVRRRQANVVEFLQRELEDPASSLDVNSSHNS